MANEAMDYVGWGAINPGAVASPANQVLLPMVRGSAYNVQRNLRPATMAVGNPENVGWTQGVTVPTVLVRCPVFGGAANWFVGTKLSNALTPSLTSGLIPKAEWVSGAGTGVFQFKLGTQTALQYTKSKLSRFRLEWSADNPVMATMLFVLYGVLQTATALDGTGPAYTGVPVGPYFMGQGVTYGASPTFDGVEAGALEINCNLQPEITTPMTVDAATGVSYPVNYWNSGPPTVSLEITQKVGATTLQDPSDEAVAAGMTVVFNDVGAANKVTFTMTGLRPDLDKTIQLGLAAERRTYTNVRAAVGSSSYAIT